MIRIRIDVHRTRPATSLEAGVPPVPSARSEARLSRRNFIKAISGGVILPAVPLMAGCNFDIPDQAVSAWRAPPPMEMEVRRWALSHALLAPNPHNLQPWLVDLRTADRITLYFDRDRKLPETDPLYRQLIIGCGAFLELLMQALAARSQSATLRMFPDGEFAQSPDERPVAVVELGSGSVSADPLFAHARQRHTHRMPFETGKPLAAATLNELTTASPHLPVAVAGSIGPVLRGTLSDIAARAWEVEVRTPRTMMESALLMRVGDDEILRHRDGISLTGFMPQLAKVLGWMTPEKIVEPGSAGFKRGLELGRAQARTAMGWIWISTAGNSRTQQLTAGRAYVRLHLRATALGVALQPMSQALQEYAEMAEPQTALYGALAMDPRAHTLQMLARVGYASGAFPSPRRELDTLIRT